MSADEFHQILGIASDASPAEIKRAYRRLAMRWHPDRNPDPEAPHQFKRVREAFERLSRTEGAVPDEAPNSPDEETPAPARGEDRRMEILLDLEEAAAGCTFTVTIDGRESCSSCGGSGQRSYGRTTMCSTCHGSGRLRGGRSGLKTCTDCDGKGFFTDKRCTDCEGRGWHPAERQIAVTIPPAMLPGEELRVIGQGGAAPENGIAGDLYLVLGAKPHSIFTLDRQDVHVTAPVSIFRLLAGGEIVVPAIGGLKSVYLPEGAPQSEVRLSGAGYPARGARPAGDLVVHLKTELPRFLGKEQKAMLDMAEQILQHNLDAQSPALARWKAVLDDLS